MQTAAKFAPGRMAANVAGAVIGAVAGYAVGMGTMSWAEPPAIIYMLLASIPPALALIVCLHKSVARRLFSPRLVHLAREFAVAFAVVYVFAFYFYFFVHT